MCICTWYFIIFIANTVHGLIYARVTKCGSCIQRRVWFGRHLPILICGLWNANMSVIRTMSHLMHLQCHTVAYSMYKWDTFIFPNYFFFFNIIEDLSYLQKMAFAFFKIQKNYSVQTNGYPWTKSFCRIFCEKDKKHSNTAGSAMKESHRWTTLISLV